MKLLSRDLLTRPLHVQPVPIPLPAADYPGARVLGTDGAEYVSVRSPAPDGPFEWVSFAQIAEDVLAGVFRLQEETRIIAIGSAGVDIEGERYVGPGAIGRALQFCSRFAPTLRPDDVTGSFRLVIESGYVAQEQIRLNNLQLGHAIITAEDAAVTVDSAFLTFPAGEGVVHYFMSIEGTTAAPVVACVFVSDGETPPFNPARPGGPYTARAGGLRTSVGTSTTVTQTVTLIDGGPAFDLTLAGFEGFWINISSGGALLLFGVRARNALDIGVQIVSGVASLWSVDCAGAVTTALRVQAGQVIMNASQAGPNLFVLDHYGQRFRRNPLADSNADIAILNGALVTNQASLMLGGSAIPRNVWTGSGAFFDIRAGATPEPTPLPSYTVGTLPTPSGRAGSTVYVSNGAAGAPVLAFSDGTDWRRSDTRDPVSAT